MYFELAQNYVITCLPLLQFTPNLPQPVIVKCQNGVGNQMTMLATSTLVVSLSQLLLSRKNADVGGVFYRVQSVHHAQMKLENAGILITTWWAFPWHHWLDTTHSAF